MRQANIWAIPKSFRGYHDTYELNCNETDERIVNIEFESPEKAKDYATLQGYEVINF
jgi:hypothetical protein